MGVFCGVSVYKFLSLEKPSVVKMMIQKNGSGVLHGLVVGGNDTNLLEGTQLTRGPLGRRVFGKGHIGLFGAKLGVTPSGLLQNFLKGLQRELHVAGVLSDDLIKVEMAGFDMSGLIGRCRKFSQLVISTRHHRGGEGKPGPEEGYPSAISHPDNSMQGRRQSQLQKETMKEHDDMMAGTRICRALFQRRAVILSTPQTSDSSHLGTGAG